MINFSAIEILIFLLKMVITFKVFELKFSDTTQMIDFLKLFKMVMDFLYFCLQLMSPAHQNIVRFFIWAWLIEIVITQYNFCWLQLLLKTGWYERSCLLFTECWGDGFCFCLLFNFFPHRARTLYYWLHAKFPKQWSISMVAYQGFFLWLFLPYGVLVQQHYYLALERA